MAYIFTDDEIIELLKDAWEEMAIFAYEQFLKHGRGLIGIDRTLVLGGCGHSEKSSRGLIGIDRTPDNDDFQFSYVTASQDATSNSKIDALVAKYDPKTEIVINYAYAEDLFRTVQIKTSNEKGPEAVWSEYMKFKKNGLKADDEILD